MATNDEAITIVGGVGAANITNAAADDLPVTMSEKNWFAEAAPNDHPVANRAVSSDYRRMECALAPVLLRAPEINDFLFTRNMPDPVWLGEIMKFLKERGLPAQVPGGTFDQAVYVLTKYARIHRVGNEQLFTWTAARCTKLPAKPNAVQFTPQQEWVENVTMLMCSGSNGGLELPGFAILSSLLPGRFAAASRANSTFTNCATQLLSRFPEITNLDAAAQAAVVTDSVIQLSPPPALATLCMPVHCFARILALSRPAAERFETLFAGAWKQAFPGMVKLFHFACHHTEAWGLVGDLLAATPSVANTSAMDKRVAALAVHLDTLEFKDADATTRTAAMKRLLLDGAGVGTQREGKTAEQSNADWNAVRGRPAIVQLLSALQPFHTSPPEVVKACAVLMAEQSGVGILLLLGLKTNDKMLRELSAFKTPTNWQLCFQQAACRDATGVLKREWFSELRCLDRSHHSIREGRLAERRHVGAGRPPGTAPPPRRLLHGCSYQAQHLVPLHKRVQTPRGNQAHRRLVQSDRDRRKRGWIAALHPPRHP